MSHLMDQNLKTHIIAVCQKKIAAKGESVGVSFYAFFKNKNKNDNPQQLMDVATWWIQTHQLDHFEKAKRIIELVKGEG